MRGAIPLLPLYAFMTWTGENLPLTVVKKYGRTRSHVYWTARRQLITTKEVDLAARQSD
jgi:hypothetical protein